MEKDVYAPKDVDSAVLIRIPKLAFSACSLYIANVRVTRARTKLTPKVTRMKASQICMDLWPWVDRLDAA